MSIWSMSPADCRNMTIEPVIGERQAPTVLRPLTPASRDSAHRWPLMRTSRRLSPPWPYNSKQIDQAVPGLLPATLLTLPV